MYFLTTALIALLASTTVAVALPEKGKDEKHGADNHCLRDSEGSDIAVKWLLVWSTDPAPKKTDLEKILTPNIASYDEAFGGPTLSLDELWDVVTAPGLYTTSDIKQLPLFSFHSCDQIGIRWGYTAVTTGFESTVPVGTKIELKGVDILHVDLKTRKIFNAMSSADWINMDLWIKLQSICS